MREVAVAVAKSACNQRYLFLQLAVALGVVGLLAVSAVAAVAFSSASAATESMMTQVTCPGQAGANHAHYITLCHIWKALSTSSTVTFILIG